MSSMCGEFTSSALDTHLRFRMMTPSPWEAMCSELKERVRKLEQCLNVNLSHRSRKALTDNRHYTTEEYSPSLISTRFTSRYNCRSCGPQAFRTSARTEMSASCWMSISSSVREASIDSENSHAVSRMWLLVRRNPPLKRRDLIAGFDRRGLQGAMRFCPGTGEREKSAAT